MTLWKNLKGKQKKMISVIVPVYKGQKYIRRIIDLVENSIGMDDSEMEIIFVNDYPEDFLERENYQSQVHIEFINHKENKGIHQTKIDGLKKSRGEFILFLDQDDTISEYFFCYQMKKIKNYDAVFCNGHHRQGEPIYYAGEIKNKKFSLENYMLFGYPLISLGQMLLKRKAIPVNWIENPLVNNGWDDHLFWVCMMHENSSVIYNDEFLYIHEEDGSNVSFNWSQMRRSGNEFREKLIHMNIFNKNQEAEFVETIEKRLAKYDCYIELDRLLENTDNEKMGKYLCSHSIYNSAIYGMGVYGRILCEILKRQKIHIRYGIDRNASKKTADFPIFDDVRRDIYVDCIFCATGFDDENIKKRLNCNCKVITMREFLSGASTCGTVADSM